MVPSVSLVPHFEENVPNNLLSRSSPFPNPTSPVSMSNRKRSRRRTKILVVISIGSAPQERVGGPPRSTSVWRPDPLHVTGPSPSQSPTTPTIPDFRPRRPVPDLRSSCLPGVDRSKTPSPDPSHRPPPSFFPTGVSDRTPLPRRKGHLPSPGSAEVPANSGFRRCP